MARPGGKARYMDCRRGRVLTLKGMKGVSRKKALSEVDSGGKTMIKSHQQRNGAVQLNNSSSSYASQANRNRWIKPQIDVVLHARVS